MTKPILTQEILKSRLHYDPETGLFTWLVDASRGKVKKGSVAGCLRDDGYRLISPVGKIPYRAHRLAWLYVYGFNPESGIDHINGIKDDNRIINLRLATDAENMQNIHNATCRSKTGLRGVYKTKQNTFRVQIGLSGKHYYLGTFKTIDEAGAAYRNFKEKFHPFSIQSLANSTS